ncbi:MAG: TIM barrel protein [Bryobacteraceae bacterium]
MNTTRRDFAKTAFAGIAGVSAFRSVAQAQAAPNRSWISGVQFGLQPFCYHDLANSMETRPELIRRLVQNGMGMVELHATWCEPNYAGPGVSAKEARDKLRNWRLAATPDYYRKIKQEFDSAGITIFNYYINFAEDQTDGELDALFEAAKALGAKGCVGSHGIALTQRAAPFPGKHGMISCIHNHDNHSDPDAYSSEQTMVKGLSFSPSIRAVLDVRHFTAGNGDCLGFLERHHDRVVAVHLGDRRKNNGRSTPFGEGDAPIIEILRMIRDNQWPIVAMLEFEHGTLRTEVEEVRLMFDYCKRALA